MNEIHFTVPGEPTGKGRPRVYTRGYMKDGQIKTMSHAVTPEKTKNYEDFVRFQYIRESKDFKFDDGAMLDMRIQAFYQIPKSKSKKVQEQMRQKLIRPTKKPDMDNVVKIIADALNNVAYHDDTQIVDVQCRKWYSDEPRVEVTIRQIG